MNKYLNILSLIVALLLVGCIMPQEPPVFKNISTIKTKKLSGTNLNLTGIAIFHNPNKMGLTLKGVEIDVIIEGKKIGHISQHEKIKIAPNADFSVPLNAEIDLKKVGLVNGIFGMLTGKRMQAEFIGYIRIVKNGVIMRVPISHKEMLKLNL